MESSSNIANTINEILLGHSLGYICFSRALKMLLWIYAFFWKYGVIPVKLQHDAYKFNLFIRHVEIKLV